MRDHGGGIAPAVADHMFEPHVRGATDVAGAGLGLSIARGIIGAHGGCLEARGTTDGASFVVTLPTEPRPGATWSVVSDLGESHAL